MFTEGGEKDYRRGYKIKSLRDTYSKFREICHFFLLTCALLTEMNVDLVSTLFLGRYAAL